MSSTLHTDEFRNVCHSVELCEPETTCTAACLSDTWESILDTVGVSAGRSISIDRPMFQKWVSFLLIKDLGKATDKVSDSDGVIGKVIADIIKIQEKC